MTHKLEAFICLALIVAAVYLGTLKMPGPFNYRREVKVRSSVPVPTIPMFLITLPDELDKAKDLQFFADEQLTIPLKTEPAAFRSVWIKDAPLQFWIGYNKSQTAESVK